MCSSLGATTDTRVALHRPAVNTTICVLEATPPRVDVFRALSEPAALAKWWGPSGFTTLEIELELEVGGACRFGMQPPDGELFHLAGEFLEIDPPRGLVYTFRWEEPGDASAALRRRL